MPELGFQHHTHLPSSGLTVTRDVSPDSVIFTPDSNFNLFSSSASCSVERCSFASDLHDHDSLLSDTSQVFSLSLSVCVWVERDRDLIVELRLFSTAKLTLTCYESIIVYEFRSRHVFHILNMFLVYIIL